MSQHAELDWARQQQWFYEFTLPDGSRTASCLPVEMRKIHSTREKALRLFLNDFDGNNSTAIDVACHEGYFSTLLAAHFATVTAIDRNADSIARASRIAKLLAHSNLRFVNAAIEHFDGAAADFVLCLGLLYHTENPLQIFRKLAALAKQAICIETQVLPFEIAGAVEDGCYLAQRKLNGLFGLCADYSQHREGGLTDLALIPSRGAVEYLLRQFGFGNIRFYQPDSDDYEQFVRNARVIVYAEK
jgi:ubiquinone/menaquinone biosynthesis C-methylase UbiE